MDPNETLAGLREALNRYHEAPDEAAEAEAAEDAAVAAEALDAWLSRGGFLPAAWGNAEAC